MRLPLHEGGAVAVFLYRRLPGLVVGQRVDVYIHVVWFRVLRELHGQNGLSALQKRYSPSGMSNFLTKPRFSV